MVDLVLVLDGFLQKCGEEKVLDEIRSVETDARGVVGQEAGKPKERLLLEPEEPLGEIDVALHLHLHHSHPDQAAPRQPSQEGELVPRVLDVILDLIKEESLGVENKIILLFSGAVWI